MKNIIIAGSARAGKSTLAKRINEELNYFVINVDTVVATFQEAYPQLDIRFNWNRKKCSANLAPFLGHYLGVLSSGHYSGEVSPWHGAVKGFKYVLEGTYLDFEILSHTLKMYGIEELKDSFILIGLVQTQKTVDEYVSDLRKYDKEGDWTSMLSDGDLRGYVEEEAIPSNLSDSKRLPEWGFTVYDTSKEREKVLDKIINDIKSRLV